MTGGGGGVEYMGAKEARLGPDGMVMEIRKDGVIGMYRYRALYIVETKRFLFFIDLVSVSINDILPLKCIDIGNGLYTQRDDTIVL